MIDLISTTPRWMRSAAAEPDARPGATAPQLPSHPCVARTPRVHFATFGRNAP